MQPLTFLEDIANALLSIAEEVESIRRRRMFSLPSGKESINLDKVLSVKISQYADDFEVLVYADAGGRAMVYQGEDAEALAKAFGLKWPETGGE
ncbi:MAG: hypothetical protein GVY30_08380 [Chloroflexi bacterium]|jgi:hypothetical protein|nr:hypothetical protein [Chloroflexota bacterium]